MSKTESPEELNKELQLERLNANLEKVFHITPILETIAKGSKDLKDQITNEITKYALSIRASKLDKSELKGFFDHPYHLYRQKGDNENTWHLAIPKFIDAQFGWLEKITESHNVFVVNPYVDWLGEIPEALKKQIGMKDPLDVYLDKGALVGKDISKIRDKYQSFIVKEEKDRLIIDKTRHFELLAALIKDGILPFVPKPVDKDDFRTNNRFTVEWKLREYHNEAWEMFLKYSNIGYFLPPSGGKTFLGIKALATIKGPHLVCVPTKLLQEQWIARLELYTDLIVDTEIKAGVDVVIMTYQSAIKKGAKVSWMLIIVDECHHLPANLFSKIATFARKYLIGLTATPQREDQREEYIFALTGKPCGLSWVKLKELGIIQNPIMNVWIIKSEKDRMNQIELLLQTPGQTIIFADSIKMGEQVAKKFDLPHVHGNSKLRLKDVETKPIFVLSRVGDEGISLPKIQRVIEISWLYGSRRQELQRFTRLLHGKNVKGEGHIIMTIEEFQRDRKRLFGIYDKGFKVVLHREGFSDKQVMKGLETPITGRHVARDSYERESHSKIDLTKINPLFGSEKLQGFVKQCNRNEKYCLKIMFNKPHMKYSRSLLFKAVGGGRIRDFASFQKLVALHLIKNVGPQLYQANTDILK